MVGVAAALRDTKVWVVMVVMRMIIVMYLLVLVVLVVVAVEVIQTALLLDNLALVVVEWVF
jgi:hypothetical protein